MPAIKSLLVSFLILAVLWNIFLPALEGTDESGHLAYIDYIAENKTLPKIPVPWGISEYYQAPLYYLTLTPFYKLFNPLLNEPKVTVSPLWTKGGLSAFTHSQKELKFGWDRTIITIHLLRFFSIFNAFLIILFSYKIAKEIFPKSKNIAFFTASLIAFNPQFIFHSATITNDIFASLWSTLTLYQLIKIFKKTSFWHCFFLGITIGLGITSKSNLLFLLPVTLIVLFFKVKLSKKFMLLSCFLLLGIITSAGWYFLRNYILYKDVLALSPMLEMFSIFKDNQGLRSLPNKILLFVIPTFETYWGRFGWYTIWMPKIYFYLLTCFCFLSSIGLVKMVINYKKIKLNLLQKRQIIILLSASIFLIAGLFKMFYTYPVISNGRFLFPTISANSILLILGIKYFCKDLRIFKKFSFKKNQRLFLTFSLFALNLAIIVLLIIPAYYK